MIKKCGVLILAIMLGGCIANPKVFIVNKNINSITITYASGGDSKDESLTVKANSSKEINERYLEYEFLISTGKHTYRYNPFDYGSKIFGPDSFAVKLGEKGKSAALLVNAFGEIYAASKDGERIEILAPQPDGFPVQPRR